MRRTGIFPVLTVEFERSGTSADRVEYEKQPALAKRPEMVKRFSPWESYTEPLIRWSPQAMARHRGVAFRLYLALEERNALVTVIDTDRMNEVDGEVARTELTHERGLGRVPGCLGVDNDEAVDRVHYRPILGGHFGARSGLPIRRLIEAVIWHTERGTIPQVAHLPGRGPLPINLVKWPDYGFDEWFQLAALYRRLAQRGTLSFVPVNARSFLLPVDIEHVTWANRRSEIVYS